MNSFNKASLLFHLIRWRLTWNRFDTGYPSPVPDNPKFMSPIQAAGLVQDGNIVATSGLAGNQRASVIFRAIRELFLKTGHPSHLTLVCTGGQGGRGIVPGTLEELGLDGLCTRLITAHFDTFVAMLRLADAGKIELQCIPQGIIALILEAQGRGENFLLTNTGIGTFIDPRTGRGSPLAGEKAGQLVTIVEGKLRYEIPSIQVAIFNAPAADRLGNIYVRNCAMIGESYEIAHAAKKNGGIVIANVGLLVEEGYDEIFLPADMMDAVVAYPDTEQTGSVPHRKYWSFFTTRSNVEIAEGLARVQFINRILGITPRRTKVHSIIARIAAGILAEKGKENMWVNIGTGLPEEVSRLLYESGLLAHVKLFTEGGAIGGIPAPGIFFGASICPEKIVSSAQIFRQAYQKLDAAVLGLLQADGSGNVNVSKKGEGAIHYVGPGGFMDLSSSAQMIIFVGSWMTKGKVRVEKDKIRIVKLGRPKFIERVDEVTFHGKTAIQAGKQVFFVTEVGILELTMQGIQLIRVMPGIDVEKDILNFTPVKIILPDSQKIPQVPSEMIEGKHFSLHWGI